MAVGSSTTFGPVVSGDSAAWPARLEAWLQRLAPQYTVEVINAGVPGYTVINDAIRLETELYRFRPDIVILYEGHNDLFGALRRGREPRARFTRTPDEVPAVAPWTNWLRRHSLLYGKVMARLDVRRFAAGGRRARAPDGASTLSPDAVIDSGAVAFERDLRVFFIVAQSLGIHVVVAELVQAGGGGGIQGTDSSMHRVWSSTVPFPQPEIVLRGYTRFNAVLRDLAGCFAATWVPTGAFGLDGPGWYAAGDPIHFTDRGADRMAEGLARALLVTGVLSAPDRPSAGRRC